MADRGQLGQAMEMSGARPNISGEARLLDAAAAFVGRVDGPVDDYRSPASIMIEDPLLVPIVLFSLYELHEAELTLTGKGEMPFERVTIAIPEHQPLLDAIATLYVRCGGD
jgi:hypothetical protein